MFDALLSQLEMDLRTALGNCVTGLVTTARERLQDALADVEKERAEGLAEVAEERAKALAEIDTRRAELGREIKAMHMHKEAQEGRVVLNIGGYRFETSVQTLRRVPHTFFDAYFSGRYAQDVCNDGSIFVDRDGEHFAHILEYMRSGVVAVAEAGARPSVSLLRSLKREFGFYCIELSADEPAALEHPEMAFMMGGIAINVNASASMKRYDASSGLWSAAAAMGTGRESFGTCTVGGNVFVFGGSDEDGNLLSSVEMYTPSTDTWSFLSNLPEPLSNHAAVAVGSTMYVLGGDRGRDADVGDVTTSVRKYDSMQGTWSTVAHMPAPRCDFAACVVGDNIFVIGGCEVENFTVSEQQSVFKYDTKTDEWSTLAPMPDKVHGHSAIEVNGLVYIVGAGGNGMKLLRFDPASGVWSVLAELLQPHYHGGSFVLGGYLYALGGEIGGWKVGRYDVAADTWTAVADMPEDRSFFGAVSIAFGSSTEEQDLFDALIAKAFN
jgi:hypothetical protein